MRIYTELCSAAVLLASCCIALSASAQTPYSKAVQQACGTDYRKYCGDYGLETAALRTCMDKAGQSLSKSCVHALIQAGEVT
jgi:hypothetical protein